MTLSNRLNSHEFTVLAVNCWDEDADTLKRFAQDHKVNYPILMNGSDAARNWGISGIPHNFLIDRSGKIVSKQLEINGDSLPKAEAKIRKLLE